MDIFVINKETYICDTVASILHTLLFVAIFEPRLQRWSIDKMNSE